MAFVDTLITKENGQIIKPVDAWGPIGEKLDPKTGLYPNIMPNRAHYDDVIAQSNRTAASSLAERQEALDRKANELWAECGFGADDSFNQALAEASSKINRFFDKGIRENPAIMGTTEYDIEVGKGVEAMREKHFCVKFDLMKLPPREGIQNYKELLGSMLLESYGMSIDISESTLRHIFSKTNLGEVIPEPDRDHLRKFLLENIDVVFDYAKRDQGIDKVDFSTGWTADSSPSRYGGNLAWIQEQYLQRRAMSNNQSGHNVVIAIDNLVWGKTKTNEVADQLEQNVAITAAKYNELKNDSFPGSSKYSAVVKRRIMSWQDEDGDLQGIKGKWIHLTHSTGEKEAMYLTTMMSQEEKDNSFFFNFAGVGRLDDELTRNQKLLLNALTMRSYTANEEVWKVVDLPPTFWVLAEIGKRLGILPSNEQHTNWGMEWINNLVTTVLSLDTTKLLPGGRDFLLQVHGATTMGIDSASSFHVIAQMYDWLDKIKEMEQIAGFSSAVLEVMETIEIARNTAGQKDLGANNTITEKKRKILELDKNQLTQEKENIERNRYTGTSIYRYFYNQFKAEAAKEWGTVDYQEIRRRTLEEAENFKSGKSEDEIIRLNAELRGRQHANIRQVDGGIKVINFLSKKDALVPQDQRISDDILTGQVMVSRKGDHYSGFVTACKHDSFRDFFARAMNYNSKLTFSTSSRYTYVPSFGLYNDQEIKTPKSRTKEEASALFYNDIDKLFPTQKINIGALTKSTVTEIDDFIKIISGYQSEALILDFFRRLRSKITLKEKNPALWGDINIHEIVEQVYA